MERKITIPYGQNAIEFSLPEQNLIGVFSPRNIPGVEDLTQEIARALSQPIGSKPLRELALGAKKVVLVADDNTRLTPTDRIIPALLAELNAAGIKDEQVTVIIALGTHRFMTEAEILAKFGEEVVKRVTVKNHDFRDPAMMVDLGTTPNGTHIMVNREAYEADFKIGIGSIVPHYIPGFAGGAKIVQPGISGEQTTAETHLLSTCAPRSFLGLRENPVRIELNSIARAVGLHTIFNTVLNCYGEVVGAFFGDTVAAFNAGVNLAQEVYAVTLPEEADIVVSSSYPCDLEFWQSHKALYPSDLAVKAGGIIILATPCPEGVSVMHADILEITGYSMRELQDKVARKEVHDEVAASLAIGWAQVKEREAVYMVSDGVCAEDAKKLGFKPFASVGEALAEAIRQKGTDARITVLTHAPDMLPIIKQRE